MKLSNLLANIEYTVINDGNPEKTDIIYDSYVLKDTHPTVTSMRNPLLKKVRLRLL